MELDDICEKMMKVIFLKLFLICQQILIYISEIVDSVIIVE